MLGDAQTAWQLKYNIFQAKAKRANIWRKIDNQIITIKPPSYIL